MDLWSGRWFPDMEMDDSDLVQQLQYTSSVDNSVDSFIFESFLSGDEITDQSSTLKPAAEAVPENCFEEPITRVNKQKPRRSCASERAPSSSSSPTIISFGKSSESPLGGRNNYYSNAELCANHEIEGAAVSLENVNSSSISQISLENPYDPSGLGEGLKRGTSRTPAQAQDHVLAERKRRERMTQRFIALSAVIPGLRKLDKANVLGDAINYIKKLQERVKKLEEEAKLRNNNETTNAAGAKRPRLSGNDEVSSSDENSDSSSDQSSLPEIEVKISEGNVLLRVYCKQHVGVIKEILGQMERRRLTMTSSSVMPFCDNRLHITIIAQMADQSQVTKKDLVDNLRSAIQTLT